MPRHFVRVNDDLLLIEIIRRLRYEPVPNVDYLAFPGVKFDKFLSAARPVFAEEKLRELLQELIDDGTLCCTGTMFRYYTPTTYWSKGLLTWLHPEQRLNPAPWFTEHGTPSKQLDLSKVKSKRIPATRVQYRFLYITGDGLPKSVRADVKQKRISFSRETLYA